MRWISWRKLAMTLGLAVAGIAAMSGLTELLLLSYRELYEPAEYDYAVQSYQPARDASRPSPALEQQPRTKAYDPHCEQPQSHEDSDLCAQWSAVRAVSETNRLTRIALKLAYLGFWVALLGGLIGFIGTYFLIRTFRENKRSAEAAVEQVRMSRESQLPDLIVSHLSYYAPHNGGMTYAPGPITDGILAARIDNRNNSVFYHEPSQFGWIVSPKLPSTPSYNGAVPTKHGVEPRPGRPFEFFVDLPLTKPEIDQIASGAASLWVWFKIEVTDIFKGRHVLAFAGRWNPEVRKPTSDDFATARLGNFFETVYDPAYRYREYREHDPD